MMHVTWPLPNVPQHFTSVRLREAMCSLDHGALSIGVWSNFSSSTHFGDWFYKQKYNISPFSGQVFRK